MGRIRYTVTTITKKCPYCGGIVDEESDAIVPLLGFIVLFTFPIAIPYIFIRFLALQNPKFPKIGPKTCPCPHCSKPILTDNYSVEELDSESLFLYKYRKWIKVSYGLGAIFGICITALISGKPVVSWFGLVASLSLVGIAIITIIYYVKLKMILHPKAKIIKHSTAKEKIKETSVESETACVIYWRKCGTKLPSDSHFCTKCGAEIINNV